MASRYDRYQLPAAHRVDPDRRARDEQYASFLRGLGALAPAAGTALGAGIGGIAGSVVPGIGTLAGMTAGGAVGGTLGAGAGLLANYGAGQATTAEDKDAIEQEKRWRALQMLGG